MQQYDITQAAESDLREIARYTIRQWGKQQAARYAGLLAQTFQAIVDRQVVARAFSERYPQVRVTRCEHHFVFYVDGKRPCIIAILHERMDMLARLTDRLSGSAADPP